MNSCLEVEEGKVGLWTDSGLRVVTLESPVELTVTAQRPEDQLVTIDGVVKDFGPVLFLSP